MLNVAVGHSDDPDTQAAIGEVLEQCLEKLEHPSQVQAGVLFAAIDFDHQAILEQVYCTFPDIELIGGTTDGELSSVLGFQEDSLTLMVFSSDLVEIHAGLGRNISTGLDGAVRTAVQMALDKSQLPPRFCLTIPESLTVSGVTLVQSLVSTLGPDIPIFGGTTGDQMQLQQTYQFFGREVCSDTVPILIFSGPLLFSHGVASGWKPLGHRTIVTRVEGPVVYQLGDETAVQYYAHYMDMEIFSQEHPLAVWETPDSERFYLRAPFQFDLETGTMTFLGDVPQGATVQLTESTRDDVLDAAGESYQMAQQDYPGKVPEAALLFSCAGRRIVLGTRTAEEYENLQRVAPTLVSSCGFYTYGEIAPLKQGQTSQFHNETMVTLLLGTE